MKAAEWIDRLKAEKGWESDYRVAKELQVGRAAISRYRTDPESTMDEDVAVRVAAELQERPELVLLDQFAERAKTDTGRAALSGLLKEMRRGKAEAVPRVAAGGRGRIDISSVTSPSAAEWATGPRGDTEYTSYPPPALSSAALSSEILLQLVARRAAQSSYTSQHSLA